MRVASHYFCIFAYWRECALLFGRAARQPFKNFV